MEGLCEGSTVGLELGWKVGFNVGKKDGLSEGSTVGLVLGWNECISVGTIAGLGERVANGWGEGVSVMFREGFREEEKVGQVLCSIVAELGMLDGNVVGLREKTVAITI